MGGIPEPPGRRDMNLNDFVVLPNNKAKSVKLNARNLQKLQMETVTLSNESKEMEEKLRQLKDSMSKEKEERGQSRRFRWMSGQCGSLSSNSPTNSSMKNMENKLQKLSAGKLKIRVLKDEPPTASPLSPPPLQLSTSGLRRKNRLKGTICGQCEVKTAGLMCAECTENYCIGCFAKFHQKGALKLHSMIPIQTDLQTHVNTRDVVNCFQRQINPSSHPGTFTSPNPSPSATLNSNHIITSNAITRGGRDESPEKGTEVGDKHMKLHRDCSQVLVVNHGEEKTMVGRFEDDNKGFPSPLLIGEYNEEESASSFQEALRQWRGEKSDGGEEEPRTNVLWIPVRPVSVSAMATQADLPPDREAEGQRKEGREERLPVKVEFKENSLTHLDRLRLKKHRRTPTETYPLVTFGTDLKSQPTTNTEEETANNLTAEEEDFRRYYATLFTAPVSRGRTEPQITTPESCLVIQVLDETCRDMKEICAAEQKTDNNRGVPSVRQISGKRNTVESQTALYKSGSSRVSHSSPGLTEPSRQSKPQPKTAQKLHSSKPQTSQAERISTPITKIPRTKSITDNPYTI
ncbi:zinc finger B-box domain-containing protein 1 [Stegastes partitus]|uniref:Zinc finger B-box domain-containing protein 1 n=1 Tax=Stegastes partitus TaxID=144197 RepID=A0A9Y4K3M1_9TELE|nr:PREDICTED: zinc finger B-box domain-containing protein 1 [Stegastes partitus]